MATPDPLPPDESWPQFGVYRRVIDALYAIPAHFSSRTVIEGILATDVQTLNTVLGATIEEQVVATLNLMRPVWDPDDQYQSYFFQRQAQVFPDVLLKADRNGSDVILGVELKGWYLLAKEKEPNFRFTVTPAACARADLIVVVPWVLSNVLSGSPRAYKPFVAPARYAAEYRNHWWREIRQSRNDKGIIAPEGIAPYPAKSDLVSDHPVADRGSNFGRIARTGMMNDYITETLRLPLSGIPADEWVDGWTFCAGSSSSRVTRPATLPPRPASPPPATAPRRRRRPAAGRGSRRWAPPGSAGRRPWRR